ncbi:MAG: substrate-binding and VWA domain-containing protein [Anaerolineae bacterium]
MSRSAYRPGYKTPTPNPGGWITILIILIGACALCWPITSGLVNGVVDSVRGTVETVTQGPQVSLTVAISPEKTEMFTALVKAFNQQNVKSSKGETLSVGTVPFDAEKMLDAVQAGEYQAVSPDSSIWLDQLDREYQTSQSTQASVVGQTVRYAVTPIVIAMWRDKAQALGWPNTPIGWSDLLKIAQQDRNFKWSHPSTTSASGVLSTLAMFYAGAGKTRGLTLEDVRSQPVLDYVGALEKTVRYYGEGELPIAQRVVQNGRDYLDAFVASEQIVIWANQQPNVQLVAIYPSEGALWQDHPLALLETNGLSDLNREAFRAFAAYVTSADAQKLILSKGYRPADLTIKLDSADSPISLKNGVDPTQPQTALQVPGSQVLDVVRESWLAYKRRTNVMLVVDTSGSMDGEKINNVKTALKTFVDQVKSDDERVGLIEFYSSVDELVPINVLKQNRSTLISRIAELEAGGDTSLLDGVSVAYDRLQALNDPERINAIVVMTDGKENASNLSLRQLTAKLEKGMEGNVPVVVFAIAYGSDADMNTLQAIASATNGQTYRGTVETIKGLYKILSTYF